MAKKLHYFHLNGLAEAIRYILHYGGHDFEDIRYEDSKWPKDTLPYGQLPFYEEADKTLNQSIAIARYVASQSGLLPSDPWQQALLDAAVLSIYDFWVKNKFGVYYDEKDPAKKAALKKRALEEYVPYYLSRFEKELKKNNGYFSGKLTWADFFLVGITESVNLFYDDNIEKNYPTVGALVETIQNLPRVKEYIAIREPYTV